MPRAARQSGPWGDALQYWLAQKNLTQADLVRVIHKREHALAQRPGGPAPSKVRQIQPNTISRVARGLHTQTSVLARIAAALGVPLPELLVSPARREEHERYIQAVVRRVVSETEPPPTIDTLAEGFVRQVERLERAPVKPKPGAAAPRPARKKR